MSRAIQPERAAVRPRVLPAREVGGEPVLLEELIAAKLARGARGHLWLIGPTGSGRTTALRHLSQCFGERDDLVLLDQPADVDERELAQRALLVSTGERALPQGERWRMAPWSEDDRIEYLLTRHRAACGSVLARCQRTLAWLDLCGHAALWSACLDELAQDAEQRDLTTALTRILERALDAVPGDHPLRPALLQGLWRDDRKDRTISPLDLARIVGLLPAALEVPSAALCLGAIIAERELLRAANGLETWRRPWCAQAIEAVASVFPLGEGPLAEVERATQHENTAVRFKALGVLHLLDQARSARALLAPERSPEHKFWLGVGLPGIAFPAAVIHGWTLQKCSLQGADLEGARVLTVLADGSDFSAARLQRSAWCSVHASDSDFAQVEAERAAFVRCDMPYSCWFHADLRSSRWGEVSAPYSQFEAARLDDAELRDCRLKGALFGTADLSGALFERCNVSHCDFRAARLERTVFRDCRLLRTVWSGKVAPGVELRDCNLQAAHFTGSVLTGSTLQGSSLVAAHLAEVSWVGCDLCDVDFTHASFHLGSTRSGLLVGAPPSWGTRTGFYPRDDGPDTSARPEQIRKADLRQCDLRGAMLYQCDLYLVDLRGALLSASQVDHLRRCKAILDREPRVE